MGQHAKFAPSGAHRWIPCPGSIRMGENIEDKPSEYAMEGTVLHTLSEACLREKLSADGYIGSVHTIEDYQLTIDEDHAWAVQYCIDEVKRITKEYGIKGGLLEVKVELNKDCWGTVDVLLFNDEYLIVIDFKFGRGKSVGAEGNGQLMIYYLGAVKHLIGLGKTAPPKAILIILQPRIPNPTRIWETTFEEVKTWYVKSVKPAIELAKNGDAPCNPGEEQCQFCPANGVCTARADYLLGVAEQEFRPYALPPRGPEMADNPINLPVVMEHRDTAPINMDQLTPEKAADILSYQKDFDNFFKQVGAFALNHALDGGEVPGYKLVYGKSNRKWSQSDDAMRPILKVLKVDPDTKPKLISPAQAEKQLGAKRKGELKEYVFKPTGKVTLVDAADSREAVDMSGEEDMAEFAVGTVFKAAFDERAETVTEEQSEIVPVEIDTDGTVVFEESTSIGDIMGDMTSEPDKEESVLTGKNSSPPGKKTKKYKVLMRGLEGGASIKDVAGDIFKGNTTNMTKSLQKLNERDGYTIIFHTNDTYTVKEAV